MFGRTRSPQARQAEQALAAGRLDEAFALASSASGGGDAGLKDVLARLCDPLLRRAQEHLIAERFAEALADLDRAGRCGVLSEKVDDWRRRTVDAMQDRQRERRHRQQAVEVARERLATGDLTMAQDHLKAAGSHADASRLVDAVDLQRQRAARLMTDAAAALARGELDGATRAAAEAHRLHAGAEGLPELLVRVSDAVIAAGQAALDDGRLDRLAQCLDMLGSLGRGCAARDDLTAAMACARRAWQHVAARDYHAADVELARLLRLAPRAAWVADARGRLQSVAEHQAAIAAGPLGFVSSEKPNAAICVPVAAADAAAVTVVAGPPPLISPPAISDRLLLRIDGVGSFLLFRGERITIGRSGPGASADLPLQADLPETAAQIVRGGDEYFLMSSVDATINDRPIRHALLNAGDRIGLGRRVKLTFLRPSRKSSAAVLELGGGLRTVSDVRRALLMSGPILLGSGGDSHVVVAGVSLVLLERAGRLMVRQRDPLGGGVGPAAPLGLGEQVELAGVRMSVSAVDHAVAVRG